MDSLTFEEQRLHLRQQLWARRQRMIAQIHKKPQQSSFPRSAIMNVLMRTGGTQAAISLATAFFARKKLVPLLGAALSVGVAVYFYTCKKERS